MQDIVIEGLQAAGKGGLDDLLKRILAAVVLAAGDLSPARSVWAGWVTGLIGYFIGHRRESGIIRSVDIPFYYPGEGRGEVFTLVAERLPVGAGADAGTGTGAGAIYPHPVFATPFVLEKSAGDVIETALRLIWKKRKPEGYDEMCSEIFMEGMASLPGESSTFRRENLFQQLESCIERPVRIVITCHIILQGEHYEKMGKRVVNDCNIPCSFSCPGSPSLPRKGSDGPSSGSGPL